MPGQAHIAVLKAALPDHEGLARAPLLGGAAVVDDGALAGVLQQVVLHRHRGLHAARPQQVVAAAVAGRPRIFRLRACEVRLLGQLGQGVKLPQQADHRPAAPRFRPEGGGDAPQVLLDLKALPAQQVLLQLGGLKFLVAHLRESPDLVRGLLKLFLFALDQGLQQLIVHLCFLLIPQ